MVSEVLQEVGPTSGAVVYVAVGHHHCQQTFPRELAPLSIVMEHTITYQFSSFADQHN